MSVDLGNEHEVAVQVFIGVPRHGLVQRANRTVAHLAVKQSLGDDVDVDDVVNAPTGVKSVCVGVELLEVLG